MIIRRSEDVGKWKLLMVDGKVDGSNAQDFDNSIQNHMNNHTKWIAFDLSETVYMNSVALGILLATLKTLKSRGGEAAIVNPHKNSKKLLQVSSFYKIFKIYLKASDLPLE